MMDVPRRSGDLLAQPTRGRIFALLVERKRALATDEMAERLGMHPNGVRRHLTLMLEAGLVERRRALGGKGRPRDRWCVAAGALPGGERPQGYSDLAAWLVRVIPVGPRRLREVERVGRQIGAELAPGDSGDPPESFRQIVTVLGFQPESEVGSDGELVCTLGNCPYRDAVRENPDLICTLHRGISAGVLTQLDPKARLERFEPHDPDQAGCLIEVGGGSWPAFRSE